MKNIKLGILIFAFGVFGAKNVLAYANCWTGYFKPGDYTVAYDSNGARYISGLPQGLTCNCTVAKSEIWIAGDDNKNKKGTTSAILTATMANKN